MPIFGWWNHFHSLWRQRTDRPIEKATLSAQWKIVKRAMASNDVSPCNADATDFTCWYVCEMLAERNRH